MKVIPVITHLSQLISRPHTDLTGVTSDQHHAQTHGPADHTDRLAECLLPAGACSSTVALDTTTLAIDYYPLPAGADNHVRGLFQIPDDFSAYTFLKPLIIGNGETADYVLRWDCYVSAVGLDAESNYDAGVDSVIVDPAARYFATPDMSNPYAAVGLASRRYLHFAFYRMGTNLLDTVTGDLRFAGMLFRYMAIQ